MKFKQNLLTILASIFIVSGGFYAFMPRTSLGVTDSVVVNQVVDTGISITSPSDVNMTHLSTSQNTAAPTAGVSWTVTTNSAGGYTLAVKASSSPAMARSGGGGNIDDYTPAVTDTPETWSVSSAAEFGFSAFGTDVPTGTWGTDSNCIAGSDVPSTTLKWTNFKTSDIQIATASVPTTTSGTASTMCVATEQNGVFAKSGSYSATITATATAQ